MDDPNGRNVNRRAMFREGVGFLGRALGEFMDAARVAPPKAEPRINLLEIKRGHLRPPGAVAEARFLTLCDRCGKCINACPERALYAAPPNFGEVAQTPIFTPERKPCVLCLELHCAKACPTGALDPNAQTGSVKMGVARLDPSRCAAHQGADCRVCYDACPRKDGALLFVNRRPAIIPDQCAGCGVCEYYCMRRAGRRAIVTLAPAR